MFWLGMLIYAASFFLPAVSWPDSESGPGSQPNPMIGLLCASFSLVIPWVEMKQYFFDNVPLLFNPLENTALLVTGWINPIFLAASFLYLMRPTPRAVACLRVIVLVLIPFCWLFFIPRGFHPREGHFMWLVGMLTVLFCDKLASLPKPSARAKLAA